MTISAVLLAAKKAGNNRKPATTGRKPPRDQSRAGAGIEQRLRGRCSGFLFLELARICRLRMVGKR
jgi:hypothetical protein